MPNATSLGIALVAALFGAGCTIERRILPVPPASIASLCIAENHKVWSAEFLPTLRRQLARHGIESTVYDGPVPAECPRHLEYTAHWMWDVAVYLQYADISIYEGDTLIGRATYDATHGSARLDKFGSGEERLAGLVDDLLRDVNRPAGEPTPSSASTP